MKSLFILLFLLSQFILIINCDAQTGAAINTTGALPDNSSILDVSSSTQGILIPRMALVQTTNQSPVTSPATSLLVYNTASVSDVTPGYYYWDGSKWVRLLASPNDAWLTLGNTGTLSGTNFLGTIDNQALDIRTNNLLRTRITTKGQIETLNTGQSVFVGEGAGANDDLSNKKNVFIGYNSGNANTTGSMNIAVGNNSLLGNTTGYENTAIGYLSMGANTIGIRNVSLGPATLSNITNACRNVAIGDSALFTQSYDNGGAVWNTNNVAIGNSALSSNQPSNSSTGINNTAVGSSALCSNTLGFENCALGSNALRSNTTGILNVGIGAKSLYSNISGNGNIAMGYGALYKNTALSDNISIGTLALYMQSYNPGSSLASCNIAIGYSALFNNNPTSTSNGIYNTAVGVWALEDNTIGSYNVALGNYALNNNTTGKENTAIGYNALYTQSYSNSGSEWGGYNVAVGTNALYSNQPDMTSHGVQNAAFGYNAAYSNTTGYYNTASGYEALKSNTTGYQNTAIGSNALFGNTTGCFNTAVGFGAYTTGTWNNSMALGYLPYAIDASNKIRLGNASITTIGGKTGWTTVSDERVKNEVKENVPGLEFIKLLRPVTYHYNVDKENEITGSKDTLNWKGKYDIEKITFSGFLAQEVNAAAQKVGYDFSGVDKSGNLWGLRYAEFVVPLVKAVQELEAKIEEQQKTIDYLKTELEKQK